MHSFASDPFPRQIASDKPPSHRPWRVLIADDIRPMADIMSLFFTLEGMETEVANNGAEAVEIAARFHPDLVCSDLDMPVMDGFEAARRIRQIHSEVILIAISGRGQPEDVRKSLDAGFDLHLRKPFSPSEMRSLVSTYLPK